MSAQILDGKATAEKIREEIKDDVSRFVAQTGVQPALAVVLVGDNPASQVYVRSDLIEKLNKDDSVHGILVQLPLPKGIDEKRILDLIDPQKDVDAFHPENVGLLSQGRPRFLPCTPYGIQQLLIRYNIETKGKRVVVIGRSDIVGKPMGLLLLQKGLGGDATVTVCHSRTDNLADVVKEADIVVAAIGKAQFVTADMIKPGAVVVDVGMNRIQKEIVDENGERKTVSKLVGDVDFDAVKEVASWITPVPGGVGPLTVTMLLLNTLNAARRLVADAQ